MANRNEWGSVKIAFDERITENGQNPKPICGCRGEWCETPGKAGYEGAHSMCGNRDDFLAMQHAGTRRLPFPASLWHGGMELRVLRGKGRSTREGSVRRLVRVLFVLFDGNGYLRGISGKDTTAQSLLGVDVFGVGQSTMFRFERFRPPRAMRRGGAGAARGWRGGAARGRARNLRV